MEEKWDRYTGKRSEGLRTKKNPRGLTRECADILTMNCANQLHTSLGTVNLLADKGSWGRRELSVDTTMET